MSDIRERAAEAIAERLGYSDDIALDLADAALSACGYQEMRQALEEAETALDSYADGEYIDGVPRGNKAMNALVTVRAALEKAGKP